MNSCDYQIAVARTTPDENSVNAIQARLYSDSNIHLIHALLGIMGEAGELCDPIKKHIIYGKTINQDVINNLEEELGDLLWYIALLCNTCSFDLEIIMQKNIDKLKLRYPKKFTEQDAQERKDKQ